MLLAEVQRIQALQVLRQHPLAQLIHLQVAVQLVQQALLVALAQVQVVRVVVAVEDHLAVAEDHLAVAADHLAAAALQAAEDMGTNGF